MVISSSFDLVLSAGYFREMMQFLCVWVSASSVRLQRLIDTMSTLLYIGIWVFLPGISKILFDR